MRVQYCLEGMKAQQGGIRILLGSNNTGGWGGHAAADRVPLFWSLDFKWVSFCIQICMTTYTLYADFRKIRLASDLRERKYYASRAGSTSAYAWRQTTAKKDWIVMSWILKVNGNPMTRLFGTEWRQSYSTIPFATSTRRRWVVSNTLRPPCPRERPAWTVTLI